MQLISKEDREERIAFYANHNIGWVARPGHSSAAGGFKRAGKFKKASKWVRLVSAWFIRYSSLSLFFRSMNYGLGKKNICKKTLYIHAIYWSFIFSSSISQTWKIPCPAHSWRCRRFGGRMSRRPSYVHGTRGDFWGNRTSIQTLVCEWKIFTNGRDHFDHWFGYGRSWGLLQRCGEGDGRVTRCGYHSTWIWYMNILPSFFFVFWNSKTYLANS